MSHVEKYRQQLQSHFPLIGGWLQNQALRTLGEDGSAEAVRVLADAAVEAEDEAVQVSAFALLRQLALGQNVSAQEALCRLVIHHDHAEARELVRAAGYLPHDESTRAVFYFLTDRWPDYESLDFDHRLLRQAYDAGDRRLRRRIAAKARQAGRIEWVEMVSGGKHGRRLGQMSDEEWRSALTVLVRGKRWEELWQLAQVGPPRWSAVILQRLKMARWQARKADRADFAELSRLAKRRKDDDFSLLMQHRATLEGHSHEVRCLAVAPSGKILASGSADRTVRLWSLPEGRSLKTLRGHAGWVNCLAITPDGKLLASAGRDDRVCLWRLPGGRPFKKLRGHVQPIFCLAMSPDGRILASGSSDSTVCLWGLPDGEPLATLKGHEAGVSCLAISPDSTLLASGSADGMVRLWNLPGGGCIRCVEGHYQMELDGVLCLAISSDGTLLASGGTDGAVLLIRLPDGRVLKRLRAHTGHLSALAITPDGKTLVGAGGDHALRLWRLPTGRNIKTFDSHFSESSCLVMSPNGRLLASSSGGSWMVDHRVRLWNLSTAQPVQALSGHTGYVRCLAISDDGHILASGSGDHTIRIWSSELGRLNQLPVGETTLTDLEWVQQTLAQADLSETERDALHFIAGLIRRRRRTDILVDEAAPRVIELGAFDIEIEG